MENLRDERERASQDPCIRGHLADLSTRIEVERRSLDVAARALECAHVEPALRPEAAITVYRARIFAAEIALDVTSGMFQAIRTPAAGNRKTGFNHFWRNVRTSTLHDPVDWKKHLVGTCLRDSTPPSVGWI